MNRSTRKKIVWIVSALLVLAFLVWRMIRPMNIFVVSDDFARPMTITEAPEGLESIKAVACGECHSQIYREWAESMHAKAWSDPYYQADKTFDGDQQICLNCHIPLQNQQEHLVLGFRDKKRFNPILKENPDFDPELQQEGVTCVVCHVRDGVIVGPYADADAPHPTRFDPELTNGLTVCHRCHVVSGNRWDTFFRIPPCGTVIEIKKGLAATIDCTGCHMPKINRPAANGEKNREGSRHLWRGGHDRDTVHQALKVDREIAKLKREGRKASLTLTNTGADHFLPTGTPDRHITVLFSLTAPSGSVIKEKMYKLKRTIMWRPFIIDLWDTRLVKNIPRELTFSWKRNAVPAGGKLAITVRYHLLDESRRKRIGYQNSTPISYPVFQKDIALLESTSAKFTHEGNYGGE